MSGGAARGEGRDPRQGGLRWDRAAPAAFASERGIYRQPNGKYAVCWRHAGRLRFRTVGFDLAEARRERLALIAATREGSVPVSPRLCFETAVGWWLERFEARVAARRALGAVIGAPIRVGDQRWDLAIANGSVWVAHWGDGTVTRIDARSGRVRGRPITVGTSEPSIGIAVGDGAVWVARPAGDSVTRILP